MSQTPTPMVYIRLRSRIRIQRGRAVKLGDIAHVLTSSEDQESRLLELELLRPGPEDGNLILIDILQIIPRIRNILPEVSVELIGSGHTLVEVIAGNGQPSKSLFILVWLLLFFGSALTIMNFHADVNMQEVQIRIVEMLTGIGTNIPICSKWRIPLALDSEWQYFLIICSRKNGMRNLPRWKWRCSYTSKM